MSPPRLEPVRNRRGSRETGNPFAAVVHGVLLLANRRCPLEPYERVRVPAFTAGEFVAYASPDSTYAVTKRFFDAARKTILIGIYDFSAEHIKELVLRAMERGVKVSLMLDVDSAAEKELFDSLARFGCEAVAAPSCASEHARFFASSHEKVIVIDDTWTLVQSGNYSNRSSPLNEQDGGDPANYTWGNRDMGLAVKSQPLARFFTKILRSDMQLQLDAESAAARRESRQRPLAETLAASAPTRLPPQLFRSKRFTFKRPLRVQPVLTPDNYMDLIPEFLSGAQRSIFLEQQYIRTTHDPVRKLLKVIAAARERNVEIKIVLAPPRDPDGKAEIKALEEFGLRMGTHVRLLSPAHFTHCHNKLVILDRKAVLISSQNWSRTAVLTNREAGLLIRSSAIAAYYARIFDLDWALSVKQLGRRAAAPFVDPSALNSGEKRVRVELGDYQEV